MNYSVLLCTYNGSKYIDEQIISILEQSILPEVIIISDDGSTDETLNVVKSIFEKYKFEGFKIINGPKNGPASNFLNGLKYNKSDYLFLSDQDDVWQKNKVKFFSEMTKEKQTQPLLIFSDSYLIDFKGEMFHDSFMKYQGLNVDVISDDSILFKNCVQGATVCVNEKLIELVIKSTTMVDVRDIMMHDWWLAIIARYYGEIKFINTPLVGYRQHGVNEIGAQSKYLKLLKVLLKPKLFYNNLIKILKQASVFTEFCSGYKINSKNVHFCTINDEREENEKFNYFSRLNLKHCGQFKIMILTSLILLGLC